MSDEKKKGGFWSWFGLGKNKQEASTELKAPESQKPLPHEPETQPPAKKKPATSSPQTNRGGQIPGANHDRTFR